MRLTPLDPVHEERDRSDYVRAGKRVTEYRMSHPILKNRTAIPLPVVELARRAGVSVGCVRMFEAGTVRTSLSKIRKIAAAIDTTVERLFRPDDNEGPVSTGPHADL